MNFFSEIDTSSPLLDVLLWMGAAAVATGLLIMFIAIIQRKHWAEPVTANHPDKDNRMIRIFMSGVLAAFVGTVLFTGSTVVQIFNVNDVYRSAQKEWFMENYDFKLNDTQINYLFEGTTLGANNGKNGLPEDEEEVKEIRDRQEKGEDDGKGPENTVLYRTTDGEFIELQMKEVASENGTGWVLFEAGSKEPLPQK